MLTSLIYILFFVNSEKIFDTFEAAENFVKSNQFKYLVEGNPIYGKIKNYICSSHSNCKSRMRICSATFFHVQCSGAHSQQKKKQVGIDHKLRFIVDQQLNGGTSPKNVLKALIKADIHGATIPTINQIINRSIFLCLLKNRRDSMIKKSNYSKIFDSDVNLEEFVNNSMIRSKEELNDVTDELKILFFQYIDFDDSFCLIFSSLAVFYFLFN